MRDADSVTFTKDQRVKAISQHIQSAMTLGVAVKNAIPSTTFTPARTFEDAFTSATRSSTPMDLIDHEHFRKCSVQEQVTIICVLFDCAGLSAKEKVVKCLMTVVISKE